MVVVLVVAEFVAEALNAAVPTTVLASPARYVSWIPVVEAEPAWALGQREEAVRTRVVAGSTLRRPPTVDPRAFRAGPRACPDAPAWLDHHSWAVVRASWACRKGAVAVVATVVAYEVGNDAAAVDAVVAAAVVAFEKNTAGSFSRRFVVVVAVAYNQYHVDSTKPAWWDRSEASFAGPKIPWLDSQRERLLWSRNLPVQANALMMLAWISLPETFYSPVSW